MTSFNLKTLNESQDGLELKVAMIGIVKNPKPDELRVIVGFLKSEEFLLRLDKAEMYKTTHINLRLNKVLRALSESSNPECHLVLSGLANSKVFVSHPLRQKILIRCLTNLRPLDPGAEAFWRYHSTPASSLSTDIAEAVLINQTVPALNIFASMINNSDHPQSLRISWLRRHLLPRRDDLPLLQLTEFLLKGNLSNLMQQKLLEVNFDFQPQSWYKSCRHPEPPKRVFLPEEPKAQLLQIAEFSLENITLSDHLKSTIEQAKVLLTE